MVIKTGDTYVFSFNTQEAGGTPGFDSPKIYLKNVETNKYYNGITYQTDPYYFDMMYVSNYNYIWETVMNVAGNFIVSAFSSLDSSVTKEEEVEVYDLAASEVAWVKDNPYTIYYGAPSASVVTIKRSSDNYYYTGDGWDETETELAMHKYTDTIYQYTFTPTTSEMFECICTSGASGSSTVTMLKGWMKGDVDHDGEVTNADAQIIENYLAGHTSLTEDQLWAADTDDNGEITSQDKIIIQRYIAGMASALTATPTFDDMYDNWWYVKETDLTGSWYTEITVPGIAAHSELEYTMPEEFASKVINVWSPGDGFIRVDATMPPVDDITFDITYQSPTDDLVINLNVFESEEDIATIKVTSQTLLSPSGTDCVVVEDNGIGPIGGASVDVYTYAGKERVASASTNSDGTWELSVAPGTYIFIISKDGYESVTFTRTV